jgi:hypothetical protein
MLLAVTVVDKSAQLILLPETSIKEVLVSSPQRQTLKHHLSSNLPNLKCLNHLFLVTQDRIPQTQISTLLTRHP